MAATGGTVAWIADGIPDIRRVEPDAAASGSGWMGLRANHAQLVTALKDAPLIPAPILLLFALGGLVAAWWREGR